MSFPRKVAALDYKLTTRSICHAYCILNCLRGSQLCSLIGSLIREQVRIHKQAFGWVWAFPELWWGTALYLESKRPAASLLCLPVANGWTATILSITISYFRHEKNCRGWYDRVLSRPWVFSSCDRCLVNKSRQKATDVMSDKQTRSLSGSVPNWQRVPDKI